jgi:hypothetical protein
MAEFDHGVKMIAASAGRELARLAGVECTAWEPAESTVQMTTEHLADRVFQARRRRERFLVYFEFYTNWDANAPWNLLAKSGQLSEREHLPTVCVVFILKPRGYPEGRRPRGEFRLEALGGTTQMLSLREVALWREEPADWWEQVPWLMALYPLTRHGRQPREAIAHAAEVIERKVAQPIEKADVLFLLDIFGGLAYRGLDVAGIIGRDKMLESRFGRELREEGKQEGRQEGELLRQRANLEKVLRRRFEAAALRPVLERISAVNDLDQLERLFDLALGTASLDEVRAAIPPRVEASEGPATGRRRPRRS